MGVIESIIGLVSPKAAFQRMQYKVAIGHLEGLRNYDGASKGRRTSGWYTPGGSANQNNERALGTLRRRSRDLSRNNPYSRRALNVIANNVVGTGIRPSIDAEGRTEKRYKKAWKDWAETKACDFDGRHNLYGLQKLVMKSTVESGEVIILKRRLRSKPGQLINFQLQVCEAEFIDTSRSYDRIEGGGFIIQGVEFDAEGRRVAYWLYDRHPDEHIQVPESKRVPISELLHVYVMERPGQVRGVPWAAPVIMRLNDFDDYENATLVRQKIAACFTAFVHDMADTAAATVGGGQQSNDMPERLEPGAIEHLPPGKDIKIAQPPAADGHEDYSRKTLQGIAVGMGITYEALTGDLSNVNFSSGRMGWLEFLAQVEDWQENMMVPNFCEGVWDWFVDDLELSTGVKPVSATWTPPRRPMIDPVKETKGIVAQIRGGLLPWQEAVRQQGYDPDDVIEMMVADMKKFDENGIVSEADARQQIKQPEGRPEGTPGEPEE